MGGMTQGKEEVSMLTGIALEGGAERSAFTAGVLDALMERGFYADAVSGTSAGAGCMLNYRSRQPKLSLDMLLKNHRERCFGVAQLVSTGKFLNLERMASTYADMMHWASYKQQTMQTFFVATCCETGLPVYLEDDGNPSRACNALKASCALPILCKPVKMDGVHFVDGSIADPIPLAPLLQVGCEKVIVVCTGQTGTKPTNYTSFRPLLHRLYYSTYPQLYHAILARIDTYQQILRHIHRLHHIHKVFVLRPTIQPISLFACNRQKILAYYRHGQETVAQNWVELCRFLERPLSVYSSQE